jgi:superfamily II DNA/RNA helicase
VHRIGRTGRAGASGIAVTFVDWADLVRWKTINKALDLPYDEPQEIYSTSPELYHDLGIPTGTKGRIKPAPARAEKPARERPARRTDRDKDRDTDRGREKDVAAGAEDEATSTERPARKRPTRSRRRTRSGRPVEGDSGVAAQSDPATDSKPDSKPDTESESKAEPRTRQRTRRRRTTETAGTETAADTDQATAPGAESVNRSGVTAPSFSASE